MNKIGGLYAQKTAYQSATSQNNWEKSIQQIADAVKHLYDLIEHGHLPSHQELIKEATFLCCNQIMGRHGSDVHVELSRDECYKLSVLFAGLNQGNCPKSVQDISNLTKLYYNPSIEFTNLGEMQDFISEINGTDDAATIIDPDGGYYSLNEIRARFNLNNTTY